MAQQILSRSDRGRDWGGRRRLIAALAKPGVDRKAPTLTTMLFIVEGHSAPVGARGFGREYHPSGLFLETPTPQRARYASDHVRLASGRISKATLKQHVLAIDAAFGQEIAHTLDPRTTTWIEAS